jgi:hypothetical protein
LSGLLGEALQPLAEVLNGEDDLIERPKQDVLLARAAVRELQRRASIGYLDIEIEFVEFRLDGKRSLRCTALLLASSETTALGSGSRLDEYGGARNPPGPLSTQGRDQIQRVS